MVPEQSASTSELVESLVGSELANRQEAFFREISELVASLAASGNRYSTALVSKMEDAGRRELRARADSIQAAWKRALNSPGNENGPEAATHVVGRLAQERASIEGVVLGVQMGSIPQHTGFLSETENLLRKRLLAELELPDLLLNATTPAEDPMQLEDEQHELLAKFVEAHLSTPRESRGTFNASQVRGQLQATFFHSRKPSLSFQGSMSDAEILAHAGFLLKSSGSSGGVTFSVLPQGIEVFQKRRGSDQPSPPATPLATQGTSARAQQALSRTEKVTSMYRERRLVRFFQNPGQAPNAILTLGSTGPACRNIRIALNYILGANLGDSELYDQEVREAVLRLQEAEGHTNIDGMTGPGTRALLMRTLTRKAGERVFHVMHYPGGEPFPRVFVSYASEDRPAAEEVVDFLTREGVELWVDFRNLQPGQKWAMAIESAIPAARFFLALISRHTLSKKGYVQKEVKTAWSVADHYPDSQVFVIPARLEACEVNDARFAQLQRVDLFPEREKGLKRLIDFLAETD